MSQRRSIALLLCVVLGVPFCGDALRGEVPAVVFVVRDGKPSEPRTSEDLRPSSGPSSTWSRLMVLESDGTRVLLQNRSSPPTLPTDFADPDVSYDGKRIVFSGYSQEESAWRLYEIGVDGEGFRQVTRSDRELDLKPFGEAARLFESYDDLDPCFLPDGRICFSSTRYPGVAPDLRGRSTNLYVADADGGSLRRITTERYGADTPSVEPQTGEIVYSRWWRTTHELRSTLVEAGRWAPPPPPPALVAPPAFEAVEPGDFSGPNSWFLASIHPDGTELKMYSGFRFDRQLTQGWRPTPLPGGRVAALFPMETPFFGSKQEKGLRIFARGIGKPLSIGGPQDFEGERTNDFNYASVAALPDGRMLVSAAPASSPNNYDLYLQDTEGENAPQRLYGTSARELDATPIVSRAKPPIIEDRVAPRVSDDVYMGIEAAYENGGSFRFLVENIFANAPVDTALASAPPLGNDLSIEFYMVPQRQSVGPRDLPVLIDKLRIPPSGRIDKVLPAGVPLFEVLRTPDGKLVQGRDGQVYHVGGQNFGQTGATARCVGCHTGHSTMPVPEDPRFTNIAPAAEIEISGTKRAPGNGDSWRPENLVDRETTVDRAEWAGLRDPRKEFWFSLQWGERVEAQEVVLYARDLGIESATVSLLPAGAPSTGSARTIARNRVAEVTISGPLDETGTHVPLPKGLAFQSLHVAVKKAATVNVATISEIEVVGRSVEDPFVAFRRGDADCNKFLDLTDALSVFGALFLGRGFCCEAAADLDVDGTVNLTDPLGLLNYLFLNGPPPAEPFSSGCGVARSALPCANEVCAQ